MSLAEISILVIVGSLLVVGFSAWLQFRTAIEGKLARRRFRRKQEADRRRRLAKSIRP